MNSTEWAAATAELVRLWNEGIPAREIGKHFGVSKDAVIGRVHRLGLVQRNPQGYQRSRQNLLKRKPPTKPLPPAAPVARPDVLTRWQDQPRTSTRRCQFIAADPQVDATMCGAPAVSARPYCAEHCALCYRTVEAKEIPA